MPTNCVKEAALLNKLAWHQTQLVRDLTSHLLVIPLGTIAEEQPAGPSYIGPTSIKDLFPTQVYHMFIMFTAALFTIARTWKQLMYPSTDGR